VCVFVCMCVYIYIYKVHFPVNFGGFLFCSFNIPLDFDINSAIDEASTPVVPKVCSSDPKGSATSSQGIRGYISAMPTFVWSLEYFI
jgi:hypothetical protein